MTDDATSDQPEFDFDRVGVDYGWFHVMRPRLTKGLIAEVGETPWAVYTIVKAFADHHTGRSYPSHQKIGELIGKSPETVGLSMKKLIAAGLLTQAKRGRHNEYQLLEAAPLTDRTSGASVGSAEFKYVPAAFGTQLAELKRFIAEGIAPGKNITLNLNVNLVQQGANGTVNLQNITLNQDAAGRLDVVELTRKLKLLSR